MYISPTIPTAYGPRLASSPSPLVIPDDPAAALTLAACLDRQADFHLSEGRTGHADRLAHLALDVRARALGVRA